MAKYYDVVIVGGGIMGLLGAYEIVQAGGSVVVIEKSTIGNAAAGSSGITRSLRSDYADPTYAELARLSWDKWKELERNLEKELVISTGNLNLAAKSATSTYAEQAASWLQRDGREPSVLNGKQALQGKFPQFVGFDYGVLEAEAGIGFAGTALAAIKSALEQSEQCLILENTTVTDIAMDKNGVTVNAGAQTLQVGKLIVTAGLGSPAVLATVQDAGLRLPLSADRPTECLYYIPENCADYVADMLPVFSCLDLGIYGHPIIVGRTPGVKIGRYHPPASVNESFMSNDEGIADFVGSYMPKLAATSRVQVVTGTDECSYDMTPDGGFAVGSFAEQPNVFVAAGFCGTGYKFAPVIAELISDFAAGVALRYDISVFNPERFTV